MLLAFTSSAQHDTITLKSNYFASDRTILVSTSKAFDPAKPYQLFVVFDEPTLFDYTTSLIGYIQQWREIPQYVVIGIPNKDRWSELQPDAEHPLEQLPFYQFLQHEVGELDWVKKASFRTLIGHSLSARFALHYFFRNQEIYKGVIAVSPPFVPVLRKEFQGYANQMKSDSYIYACSGDKDLRFHKSYFEILQKQLKHSRNKHIQLEFFEKQPNMTHALMPVTGIQNGLLFVMEDFFHLPEKEIESHTGKKAADSLLEQSYQHISDIYGILPKLRTADIQNYVDFYLKKSNFEEAHRLTDMFIQLAMAREIYDLIDAYFLKGTVYEKQEQYSLALEFYKKGYAILPEEVVNKADFEVEILRVEKRLGQSHKKPKHSSGS
jgi:predicted alpha/beta superfamily hydrolase